MTAHPHAESMRLYAEDAAEMDKPWERWEVCDRPTYEWRDLEYHPEWNQNRAYRRKPSTIRIGKFDVPEPMRVAPMPGEAYWVADPATEIVYSQRWDDDGTDNRRMARGLCHATREAAELHARALISLTAEGGG